MSEFELIGKATDIQPGEGQSYTVGERIIGVFNVDGDFFAINDLCPHMGASLSAGFLDGCQVACPWHAWRFSVTEGTWCDNPKLRIETFETRVEGDDLYVAKEPTPEPDSSAPGPTGKSPTPPTEG